MLKENERSCEFLDLLVDGYEVFWQTAASDVTVEDLDLIACQFEKRGYDVATVIQAGIVTVFRKKR